MMHSLTFIDGLLFGWGVYTAKLSVDVLAGWIVQVTK